jgi:metal-responsive CopG/Arc/MetJ family transcriptional regulator
MEFKKHINIRITEDQFKRLKLAIAREKKTMSQIIRRILKQYIEQNPQSVTSKSTGSKAV